MTALEAEMTGIIVAAGMGTRLYPHTKDTPKCLLTVGGKRILAHQIEQLRACGIRDIIVVTGYRAQQIRAFLGETVTYVHNEQYAVTNNLFSLWLAARQMSEESSVYLHSDLLFDGSILRACLSAKEDISLVVEERRCVGEEMRVRASGNRVFEVSKALHPHDTYGEFIGMAKLSSAGLTALVGQAIEVFAQQGKDAYFAAAVTALARKGYGIHMRSTLGAPWIEIDFQEELLKAEDVLTRIGAGARR